MCVSTCKYKSVATAICRSVAASDVCLCVLRDVSPLQCLAVLQHLIYVSLCIYKTCFAVLQHLICVSVRIKERVATKMCRCVAETDSGEWGAWSGWTQCTSSCGGGTRSRFRFCDSPPPRYGAKFCEVSAVIGWTHGRQ
jgi:hypothetical protein